MAKYMIIDGNRVEFNDEPNILALVRKAESIFLLSVTILIYLSMVRAECVW